MSIYKHSQVGTLILWILGIAAAGILLNIFLNIASGSAIPVILVAIAVVLLACMLLFGTLTVEVAQDRIKLWFGPGLIRKEFRSSDILSAKAVRNRWFYGWGIRLTPHG